MKALRSAVPISALLFLAGCCSSGPAAYDHRLGGSQVYHLPDGTIYALGSRSRYESEEFLQAESSGRPWPRWREFLRLGRWEYRYPNGRTKAHITYELAWYTECCTAGPCEQPYELRSGAFEAWWPDGRPLARGSFVFDSKPIETNCEGGDRVKEAKIGPDAEFWDQQGNRTDRSVLAIAGVPLEQL